MAKTNTLSHSQNKTKYRRGLILMAIIGIALYLIVPQLTGLDDSWADIRSADHGWLLVTGGVLSFASGIIHPYYTVALAPAIAAVPAS